MSWLTDKKDDNESDGFSILQEGETYKFDESTLNARFIVEWTSFPGNICDLDLNVYCYDDKARFVEKLDFTRSISSDSSTLLVFDEGSNVNNLQAENATIQFSLVSKEVSSFLLFLDGDSRNFQIVSSLLVKCIIPPSGRIVDSFVRQSDMNPNLFKTSTKTHKEYKGLVLCSVYKDKWQEGGQWTWAAKSIMEPVYLAGSKDKDEKCNHIVINHVPSLEKFRPRIFASVRMICGALSSQALPKLKVKFQRGTGLDITQFVEALYKQLKDSHPKILEDSEAAYTVAMLEEMFYQIDFNGDGDCSWDEFTNFAIQAVLSANNSSSDRETGSDSLNEYVIEYGEDYTLRDTVLSPFRKISSFRYFPKVKRICIIQEDADCILLFNENFEIISKIYPCVLQSQPGSVFVTPNDASLAAGQHVKKFVIYDVIFLEDTDYYVYCASDHTIGICKEHISHGGTLSKYTLYNKIFHNHLHVKLCYSKKTKILCSISSNRVIYGWDLDGNAPIFNISRHSDMITDFIPIDDLGSFATCSLDKRIVVWSATTRRVKALFIGHKRGIRQIHYSKNLLLSVAFETDARIWDLNSKDCVVILRGHRTILTTGLLMCDRARDFEDYRAITCDEAGELKLWNIHVREKTSDPYLAPAIQTFNCQQPEIPICNIKYLALPSSHRYSTSYYSDLVACSTKLLHFLPEKNSKEFIPPSCLLYNDPASVLVTAVGPNLVKYDIASGSFLHTFTLHKKDISALTLDGDRGRKMYAGCANGDILTVNFVTGDIVNAATGIHSKDITRIVCHRKNKSVNLFTCSLDGKLRMIEEISGELHIKNTVENTFGEGVGVLDILVIPSLRLTLAAAIGKEWGLFNMITFKQLALFQEDHPINAVNIIGASGDDGDEIYQKELLYAKGKPVQAKESLLTIAIAITEHIKIYTMDVIDFSGTHSMILKFPLSLYVNAMILFKAPRADSVNFSIARDTKLAASSVELILSVCSDDGYIVSWDATDLRTMSENAYRSTHNIMRPKSPKHIPSPTSTFPNTPARTPPAPGGDPEPNQENKNLSPSIDEYDFDSPPAEEKIDSFLTENFLPSSPHSHSHSHSHHTGVDTELQMDGIYILTSSFNFPHMCSKRESYKHWKAHWDSIQKIICLGENGCIQSTSHDGYQRCWNVDGDCLGELLLPNVTDKMLKPELRTVSKTLWKFLLEKIAVQPRHIEIAKRLTEEIKALSRKYMNRSKLRSSIIYKTDILLPDEENEETKAVELTGTDLNRSLIFQDLRQPPQIREDAPPTRIQTKEEIRLMKQLQKLEAERRLRKSISAPAIEANTTPEKSVVGNDQALLPIISEGGKSPNKNSIKSSQKRETNKQNLSNTISKFENLWSQPKDIFRTNYNTPTAFSAESMLSGFRSGEFDKESLGILRRVSSQPDKVSAYEHVNDTLLLRSAPMSTSIEIPKGSGFKQSEVLFGTQSNMYKNADLVLSSREKPSQAENSRNIIALARIDQNLNKVGSMIHVLKHNAQVLKEVTVPSNESKDSEQDLSNKTEEQQMQLRLYHSSILAASTGRLPRPLDPDLIATCTAKVENAMSIGPEYDIRTKDGRIKKRGKHRVMISQASKLALEKKLQLAIKDIHRPVTASSLSPGKKIVLTNRMLLPYYKVEDIRHYMDVFTAVDIDFSGDLDVNEWVKLFTSMDDTISQHQARMIFMQLNKSGDGVLTSKDLIPIIFNKASKEQMHLITAYVQSEIIQKRNDEHCLSPAEVAQLFECYDVEAIGFVNVSIIRDRIRAMQLPEVAHFGFMNSIVKLEEDEMLNEMEFARMLRPYSVR